MTENLDLTWHFHDVGTAGGLRALSLAGGLPTFNFQEGSFEGNEKITGTTMRDTILIKRDTCYACAVRCKRSSRSRTPSAHQRRPDLRRPRVRELVGAGQQLRHRRPDCAGEGERAHGRPRTGTLGVAAVKSPGFGDRRKAILEDIAVLTGAKVITDDSA